MRRSGAPVDMDEAFRADLAIAMTTTSVPIVLLAAGLGSRFGGIKPLAPVGPDHEALLTLSLEQARRAGFASAVIVVGPLTREAIISALRNPPIPVSFADQVGRDGGTGKPWGTVDALASTGLHGPLVVANGDDLYGVPALADALAATQRNDIDGAAVMFPVGRTLSGVGGVSRAEPVIDESGLLRALSERRGVERHGDEITDGTGRVLEADAAVSMNLWSLRAPAVAALVSLGSAFRARHAGDPSAELGLPDAVGQLVADDRLRIAVTVTESTWHGVTFADDVAKVRAELIADGGA
jgi:molybdopterin-guanine dinucleotide biosynthesis protein A